MPSLPLATQLSNVDANLRRLSEMEAHLRTHMDRLERDSYAEVRKLEKERNRLSREQYRIRRKSNPSIEAALEEHKQVLALLKVGRTTRADLAEKLSVEEFRVSAGLSPIVPKGTKGPTPAQKLVRVKAALNTVKKELKTAQNDLNKVLAPFNKKANGLQERVYKIRQQRDKAATPFYTVRNAAQKRLVIATSILNGAQKEADRERLTLPPKTRE